MLSGYRSKLSELNTVHALENDILSSILIVYQTCQIKNLNKLKIPFSQYQKIYRPGTAISHASNPCTALGGDRNKEFTGNASFLREKGPRGG